MRERERNITPPRFRGGVVKVIVPQSGGRGEASVHDARVQTFVMHCAHAFRIIMHDVWNNTV